MLKLVHLGLIFVLFITSVLIISQIKVICSRLSFDDESFGKAMLTFHKMHIHYPGDEVITNGISIFLSLIIVYLLSDYMFFVRLRGWKKALSVILSVIVILGGTELSMSYFSRMYPILHRPHPTLLWEHTPNYGGITRGFKEEVFINSHGFRSPDISRKKPAGQTRILLLGDSSAYGFSVRNQETFGSVLTQKLRAAYPGRDVRLLNAAVAGWTTYQAVVFMKERGWEYSPDIIIIAFNNDSWGEWKEDRERVPPAHLIPVMRLLYRSNIYLGMKKIVMNARLKQDPKPAIWPRFDTAKPRVSVEDFRKNLNYIAEGARQRNAEVMIVSMPLQVAKFKKQAYREAMKEVADKNDFPCICCDEDFAGLPVEEVFIDMMHPTAKGHQIIGNNIYGMITQKKWIEK